MIFGIDSCQTISAAGTYYLTQDIVSGPGNCLDIQAPGVTIDCQGFSINGLGAGYGINLPDISDGSRISNCIIDGFSIGVRFYSSSNNVITNVTVQNNVADGFDIYYNSDNNILTNVKSLNNGDVGIEIHTNSHGNTIQDSLTMDNSAYGLRLDNDDSSGHQIMRNNFSNDYVYYLGSHGQTFTDNVYDMGFTGLNKPITLISQELHYLNSDLSGGARFIFSRGHNINLDCQGYSIMGSNGNNGLHFYYMYGGVEVSNCIIDGFSKGVYMYSSSNNVFTNVTVQNNVADGFDIYYNSDSNTLTNVQALNNGDVGIEIRTNSDSNIIQDSLTMGNSVYGLRLDNDDSSGHHILRNNFTSDYVYYLGHHGQTFTNNVYDMDFTGLNKVITLISQEPHYLSSDLSGTARFILSRGTDISLDCQGHSITGSSVNNGLHLYYISGAEVSNCIIDGFNNGVVMGGSSNNIFTNITVQNSASSGFYLYSASSSNIFTDIIVRNNGGDGFDIYDNSDSNTLTNVQALNNGDVGIEIRTNSHGNVIQDSLTMGNSVYGLRLDNDDSYSHQILRNNFTSDYVYYLGHHGQTFTNNVYDMNFTDLNKVITLISHKPHYLTSDLSGAGRFILSRGTNISLDCQGHSITGLSVNTGLYFYYISGAEVSNCIIDGFNNGVRIGGSSNNVLTNITVQNSASDGVYIYANSNSNILSNITVQDSGGDGFDIYDNSDSNLLTNVQSLNNIDVGIEIHRNSHGNVIQDSLTMGNAVYGLRLDNDDSYSHQILRNNFTSDYVYYLGHHGQTFTNNVYDMNFTGLNKPITLISQEPHYLTSNLSGAGRFILSRGTDISLDCQGHSIIGSSVNNGLHLYYISGAKVSNCMIDDFNIGVAMGGSSNNILTNITVQNSASTGFYIYTTSNSNAISNVIVQNSGADGFFIYDNSDSNTLTNVQSLNNGDVGIEIQRNSHGNTIQDSLTMGNSVYGLRLDNDDSYGHNILRNNFTSDYVYYLGHHAQTFTDNVYDMDFSGLNKPITVVSSGTHYLTSNIVGGGKFIFSRNPSVKFDCQGNKIIGDTTGNALHFYYTSGQVTVDRCVIENFNNGIYMAYADNHIVKHSNFTNNANSVYLTTSADNNLFYYNYYENGAEIYKAASVANSFTATINGSLIGNYWADINCLVSEGRETYFVCTDPSSYSIGTTGYIDNAPLTSWIPVEPITVPPTNDCSCPECNVSELNLTTLCANFTIAGECPSAMSRLSGIFPYQDNLVPFISLFIILGYLFS